MRASPAAAVFGLIVASAAAASAQQQGSIQLSTESQIVSGDAGRMYGEQGLEPDFGLLWQQPGTRFGQFLLETRGTKRGDAFHLGRTWIAVRDARMGGLTWAFEGGDLYTSPSAGDYQFSNLSTPSITFGGGAVTARTARLTLQAVAGRTTALRNIFGTDPETLGQALGLARATYRPSRRVQLNARALHTRTWDLHEFARGVDASDQAGGGARVTITPWMQIVADGSYVRYRAAASAVTTPDFSYLVGTHLLLARGWVQVNANRYSPGDLPLLNAPLQDRKGVFAAAEYDVLSRVRLFGGWETVDTNINPAGIALLRPAGSSDRGYGGARMRVGQRSSFSVRLEEGDRLTRPVSTAAISPFVNTTTDTGVFSTEWQTNVRKVTAFGRYSRRSNVDAVNVSSTFTQHDASAQAFLNLSRTTQLFGGATVTHQEMLTGSGSTYLQLSAGGQRQVMAPGLWLRVEGTASRNRDLLSGLDTPRNALNVGLNGQITRHTMVGLNVYVDRAPLAFGGTDNGWLTRSTIRVVHTIPTGAVRVSGAGAASAIGRPSRGTGSVLGSIFADWNANGLPDPGEDLLAGIPVQLGSISHVTTARDGQFAFLNVPAGPQRVGVDLAALPVDFDPPAAADVLVELGRGDTKRVAFGLVPLGGVSGRVVEDANKNGQADPAEPTLDGAVLTLDGGQRSELAKKGNFRFEAVRAGAHRLLLLKESLPEGTAIVGGAERPVTIEREHPQVDVTYLVRIEKRPEVRKVFPPKIGANAPANLPARAGSHGTREDLPARAGSHGARAAGPSSRGVRLQPEETFTIQIAALNDPMRAKSLVTDLAEDGFPAYLVEPGPADPDGPYRVRVGRYASRLAAQETVAQLQRRFGEKLWVTTSR